MSLLLLIYLLLLLAVIYDLYFTYNEIILFPLWYLLISGTMDVYCVCVSVCLSIYLSHNNVTDIKP